MKRIFTLAVLAAAVVSLTASCGGRNTKNNENEQQKEEETMAETKVAEAEQEPMFDIVTSMGTIRIKLYSKTPKHRDNFCKLVKDHYYDKVLFHRVIKDFMIQTGDPYTKDTSKVAQYGTGGPGYTIPAEFVKEYYHKKGAVAAARMGDFANPKKASSGSQFYIVQNEMNCLHLDGEYTVFGETVKGLDVIDRIASVQVNNLDRPLRDVYILTIRRVKPEAPKETAPANE